LNGRNPAIGQAAMFRPIRLFFLLLVLAFVSLSLWTERARIASWENPLWVVVYPIRTAGSGRVDRYVSRLREADFRPIERYLDSQAQRYGLPLRHPVEIKLAAPIDDAPPTQPARGDWLATIWFTLRLRYWAWRHDSFDGPTDVQIFVTYDDPDLRPRLAHSLGLEKGRIGLVNAYGVNGYAGRNHVVITHELLHTVGATDKYDLATGQPLYPDGYADPGREPRYPQARAEIMGGQIPLGPDESTMPDSLRETVIGPRTAREIGWT